MNGAWLWELLATNILGNVRKNHFGGILTILIPAEKNVRCLLEIPFQECNL